MNCPRIRGKVGVMVELFIYFGLYFLKLECKVLLLFFFVCIYSCFFAIDSVKYCIFFYSDIRENYGGVS